jgi:excisionase family DNA binding protein
MYAPETSDRLAGGGLSLAEPLLCADEIGSPLAVPRSSVYEYARRRHDPLPSVRIGRHVRFCRSDVERWLVGQRPRDTARAAVFAAVGAQGRRLAAAIVLDVPKPLARGLGERRIELLGARLGALARVVEGRAQPLLGAALRVVADRGRPRPVHAGPDPPLELAAVGQPVLGIPHGPMTAVDRNTWPEPQPT